MKVMITLGVVIGSSLFGWFGAAIAHGNWFSGWSILLSGLGGLMGIWIGYRVGQYLGL